MNLIIITQEDLAIIVKNAVKEAIVLLAPQNEKPKMNLTFNEGLKFLNENSYKLSQSQLYKKTMDNSVPCSRFGRKVVFRRDELEAWAASRSKSNRSDSIAKFVAANASKKGGAQK